MQTLSVVISLTLAVSASSLGGVSDKAARTTILRRDFSESRLRCVAVSLTVCVVFLGVVTDDAESAVGSSFRNVWFEESSGDLSMSFDTTLYVVPLEMFSVSAA